MARKLEQPQLLSKTISSTLVKLFYSLIAIVGANDLLQSDDFYRLRIHEHTFR